MKAKPSTNNTIVIVLSVFAVVLVALIVFGLLSQRGASSTAAVPTVMQLPTTAPTTISPAITGAAPAVASDVPATLAPTPQNTDAPTNAARVGIDKIPPDTKLIVSTVDHDIQISSDGISFRPIGFKGDLPTISPDGQSILFVQSGEVLSYHDKQPVTTHFFMSGLTSNLVMSADSRLILTSDYDPDNNWITVNRDRLYWSSDPGYGITMTSVPNSSIPAVIDPKTNRILVGQKTGDHETTLYTIEQACLNSACDQSRQDVAKVPYSVNWVNYQPDGSNIVFSEDDGNIYLLSVSTKQVTPVLVDATKKSRPVFSADASELLYLDANRGVNILRLSDKKVLSTGGLKIVSANWIVQPAKTASTPATPPGSQAVKARVATTLISNISASSSQQLVVATTNSDILISSDGVSFSPTGLKGSIIAPSPDGKTLAYSQIGQPLQLLQGDKTFSTRLTQGRVISWSQDSKRLFELNDNAGWGPKTGTRINGFIFHIELADAISQASPVNYGQNIPSLGGPAISNPQSNRLTMTQVTGPRQTGFISIDANCAIANKCFDESQQLATVPYTVNWISGSPDGNTIVFSEDDGNIYLVALDTGKVIPLLVSPNYKTHPEFSPDGKQIAFIDQDQQLNILQMSDKSIKVVTGLAIISVGWEPAANTATQQASAATPSAAVEAATTDVQGVGYIVPDDAQLMISITDHDIMISRDLKVFEPTGLKGDDVSAAPDRKTLAYFRGDRMWIYQDGAEASFNLIGPTQSNPIWSQDVQMMIFDTITERGTEIIRSGIGTRLIDGVNSATRMSNVFVPPIFDPMTGNLLLAVSQTGKKTEFTTVDPLCVEDECQQTRSLGTVPYEVTSISFLPDGSAIAFSEKSGNIYLFSISTGNVSPLIVNKTHKSRIAVSGDGSRIAYLDDLQQLYILNLKDKSIKSYSGLKVQNMNWLR